MRNTFMKTLCAGMACLALGAAGAGDLNFEFKELEGVKGWGKTGTITLEPQADSLKLMGNGWDSKIFRGIQLEPGYYLITATGKGDALHIKLAEDLCTMTSLFDMNLSRNDWRTDWRPLTIEKPSRLQLIVHLQAGEKTEAWIKQIKIEKATPPPEETGIPSVAELEKSRPAPEIVRGADCGDGRSLADLRAWHGNVARTWIPLKPSNYVDGMAEYKPGWESQLKQIEGYLAYAKKAGVKVILTVDAGAFMKGKGSWGNPRLPEVAAKLWRGIAQTLLPYKDAIYGYDLCNEPLDWEQMPHAPREWRGVAKEIIKAIREVDKDTWIVYEPGPGGMHWGFADMKPLPDDKVIYSLHYYSPHEFTHQGISNIKGTDLAEIKAKLNVRYPGEVNGFLWNKESIRKGLASVRQFQVKYKVPILVGEFSVIRWAPQPDSAQYLKDLIDIFEDYHWSWTYHAFREWYGWSVECDETFCADHNAVIPRAPSETERAKAVKAGLAKNEERNEEKPQAQEDANLRSQCAVVSDLKSFKPSPDEFRICFLGDSITRHSFNKDIIERLKWDHVAGMAASAEDKDYAHLVAGGVGKLTGRKVQMFFGSGGESKLALKGLATVKLFQPDLVIVQQGEHVPSKAFGSKYDQPREEIAADYAALLDALKELPSKPLIICTGIWDPFRWKPEGLKNYPADSRPALIETVQREVAEGKGVAFVSVEKYALDRACSGTGGSGGVQWHPNDAGHAGYAKEILAAFEKLKR